MDRDREREIYWKQTSTKLQSATVVCQSKKQQWIHLALSVRFPSKNRGQPWYETYVRLQLFGWEEILKTRTHCIRNPIFSVPDNKTFGRTHIRLTFSLYSCVCIVCVYVCVVCTRKTNAFPNNTEHTHITNAYKDVVYGSTSQQQLLLAVTGKNS